MMMEHREMSNRMMRKVCYQQNLTFGPETLTWTWSKLQAAEEYKISREGMKTFSNVWVRNEDGENQNA